MFKMTYRVADKKTQIRIDGFRKNGKRFQIEYPLNIEKKREILLELGLMIACPYSTDKRKEQVIRGAFETIAHINKSSTKYMLEYALGKFVARAIEIDKKELG